MEFSQIFLGSVFRTVVTHFCLALAVREMYAMDHRCSDFLLIIKLSNQNLNIE